MKPTLRLCTFGMALFLAPATLLSAIYHGNGVVTVPDEANGMDFDGTVGTGTLTLNDSAGAVSATFAKGNALVPFQYNLVLFIDSVSGGIGSTALLAPHSNYAQQAISGLNAAGSSRATMVFASGFQADYAVVINPSTSRVASGLYQFDSATSYHLVKAITPSPMDGGVPQVSFGFNWSDISGGGPTVNSFKFQSTYIDSSGFRSLESFEPLSGTIGYGTVTAGSYNVYSSPVPEPVNVALAIFGGIAATAGAGAKWLRRHCSF